MAIWSEDEKKKTAALIAGAKINHDTSWYQKNLIPKIIANKERYKVAAKLTGLPLAMIPLIHSREMTSDVGVFKCYLGNGQPLNQVTTIVPKGRGPFLSWELGVADAIHVDGLDQIKDWSLERMFFQIEGYNGFGYRGKGINSPYVYNYTTQYSKGAYVSDGNFSPNAVDGNMGCLALYMLLAEADKEFSFGAKPGVPVTIEPVPVATVPPDEIQTPAWFEPFKKWILLFIAKLFGPSLPPLATDIPVIVTPVGPQADLSAKILQLNPQIPTLALMSALAWKDHPAVLNKSFIILVDFSKNEKIKREHVIDMRTFDSADYKVAHGAGSDPNNDGLPTLFSNVDGSHESSLGAMVIKDKYSSAKFKFARRLIGLEKGINDNVEARAIVWHSSTYVDDVEGTPIGDSWGCFAHSEQTAAKLIDSVGNCLLYVWHDSLKG